MRWDSYHWDVIASTISTSNEQLVDAAISDCLTARVSATISCFKVHHIASGSGTPDGMVQVTEILLLSLAALSPVGSLAAVVMKDIDT